MKIIATLALVFSAIPALAGTTSSSATGPLDITKSSVADDLEAFYGERYGDKIIQNLVPSRAKGDDYNDFKFFHFYPWQGDLYFYFYASAGFTFDSVVLEYSDGATFDGNTAIEDWHLEGEEGTPTATIEDTFGKMQVFYKCKIADFYEENEGSYHRIFLKTVNGYTSNDPTMSFRRACQDAELLWEDGSEGEDLVYRYYKDDYIVIDDAAYYQQWIPTKYNGADQRYPTEMNEINWLFFSWSGTSIDGKYELGSLKEVTLDYQYLTYEATATVKMDTWGASAMVPVYTGTYDHPELFTRALTGATCDSVVMGNEQRILRQTVITPQTRTIDQITDEAQWWQFWLNSHRVTYTYNTIQSLDANVVRTIGDDDTRNFFQDYVGQYKYAIMMKQDLRYIVNYHTYNSWGMESATITSEAHEITSARMTRLTFNSEFGDVSLNAMMHEVTLTGIFKTTGTLVEIENKTTATIRNILKWALIGLGTVLGIALIARLAVWIIKASKKR